MQSLTYEHRRLVRRRGYIEELLLRRAQLLDVMAGQASAVAAPYLSEYVVLNDALRRLLGWERFRELSIEN